jgi:N-acetylmuramoyl-L-alanine amidase
LDGKAAEPGRDIMRSERRSARAVGALALLAVAVSLAAGVPAEAARRLLEKQANLDIARRVQARLAAAGVPVVMTRTSDATVSLASRVARANARHVDAFVSIHNNSSHDHQVGGGQVYYQIRGGASATLGSAIRAELARSPGLPTALLSRRGDHGDYYYVLRNTRMPAVIVESAFLSNPSEARLLATSSFRQRIADSIARGILNYQRTLQAAPLPALAAPHRVVVPVLPAPAGAAGFAVNARTVTLQWTSSPTALAYHVYRDGTYIGSVDGSVIDALTAGPRSVSFTDVWAAPGQRYTYQIVSAARVGGAAVESRSALVSVRTPPILVALDPGHGGADPGAAGWY